MSHYTVRGFPNVASEFVVAAVTGYFHSIACAANAKGVDDSLQVNVFSGYGELVANFENLIDAAKIMPYHLFDFSRYFCSFSLILIFFSCEPLELRE